MLNCPRQEYNSLFHFEFTNLPGPSGIVPNLVNSDLSISNYLNGSLLNLRLIIACTIMDY